MPFYDSLWLTPLIFLPGVALLILSTSARYNRLHDEVHELLEHGHEVPAGTIRLLMRRAHLFRNALVALYVCVGLFAVASLFGAVFIGWSDVSRWIVIGLLGIGISCLSGAAAMLIRESILSLDIIRAHARGLTVEEAPAPET